MTNDDSVLGLTWDSTPEEVRAAADEHERRGKAALAAIRAGDVACSYGAGRVPRLQRDPMLLRQAAAGEEDQSVPGWDQGA